MLDLFPEGYVEAREGDSTELAAFTDAAGAERLRSRFADVRVEPVPDGWEDEWKRFHRPVEIGSLWVGPPWDEPAPGLLPVVIDPGRAFGTGAHPTTQLCLELLQEADPGSLADLGCGSGVVSIAAVRLGHSPVVAVDVDEAAVEATRVNASANRVEVEVRQLDLGHDPVPEAEIIVANIDLATIALLGPIPAGTAITSGYYTADRPTLEGFDHVERRTRDDWSADLFRRE
jgi:ribosomal protein L11 methyltransferase